MPTGLMAVFADRNLVNLEPPTPHESMIPNLTAADCHPPAGDGTVAAMISLATGHLRSEHSRRAYGQALLEFFGWCAATRMAALTRNTVREYLAELNRLHMAAATVNLALCAIRKLVAELAENGLTSMENAAGIAKIKGPRRRGVRLGKWLSVEDAERLVGSLDACSTRGKRDRALIAVLLSGGLRRSEVAQLTVTHLQEREGRWVIVDLVGKGNRIRSVPIPAWTKQYLDDWIAAAKLPNGPIFRRIDKAGKVYDTAISPNAIYQIVRRYAEGIDVEVAPHDLRRTFARLAHQGNAGIDQIQMTLGHSSVATTERYLGARQNLRDAPCDHLGLKI